MIETEQMRDRWGHERLVERQAREIGLVAGVVLISIAIAAALLTWEWNWVSGIALGIALVLAAFLRPEMTLLAVTLVAPLAVQMAKIGALIPGTGITPVNGLVLMLAIGAWAHRYSSSPPAAEATEVDKPLLLFLLWSSLSIVTATIIWVFDPTGIGEWLQMAAGYITYWVVRRRWNARGLVPVAVFMVMGLVVYESCVVIWQYAGQNNSAFNWDLKKNIVGTFPWGNSNDIGTYLASYGLVALGLVMAMRRSFWRWPALAVFLLAGAAAFATYSRAAVLGMVVGGLCMTLYKHRRFLLPIMGLLVLLPVMLPGSISNRFSDSSDSSAESRKDTWKRGFLMTLRYPILGVGWRGYSKKTGEEKMTLRDPHNMYLLVGSEQGIPGLVFYVGTLLAAGKLLTRVMRRKNTPLTEALALGLFGALVCFVVNNVFGSRMIYYYSVQHFWLLLGFVAILSQPPKGEADAMPTLEVEEPVAAGPKPLSPWRYRSYL